MRAIAARQAGAYSVNVAEPLEVAVAVALAEQAVVVAAAVAADYLAAEDCLAAVASSEVAVCSAVVPELDSAVVE